MPKAGNWKWQCTPEYFFGAMAKNGSTRCFFGQKRMYVPENNSGRECCWPYLIGQHPLSPVFGRKRPGTPGNSYFAQLPPVFGHFLFRFWPYYVPFRSATRLLEQIVMGQNFALVTWRLTFFSHFSVNKFGCSQPYPCLNGGYSRSFITPARTTTRTSTVRQGDA